MKGAGKSIELEKLDEKLNTFFTERAVSSSTLATPGCGHLWARIHHDRPFPVWQRNILLWWVSQFVPGCICAAERLLLLLDTTAHHGTRETMEKRQGAGPVGFHCSWQMFSKAFHWFVGVDSFLGFRQVFQSGCYSHSEEYFDLLLLLLRK